MIKGTDIKLLNRRQIGTDGFDNPVYEWHEETVHNVLIGQPDPADQPANINLYGREIAFNLGIPKGDTHDWRDKIVEFFGEKFMTIGIPQQGIEANIPGPWHKIVRVVRYE